MRPKLRDKILSQFDKTFKLNNKNDISIYFSPGRVNLIGEHTDYTGGMIFAVGINMGTYIFARYNNSNIINILSLNINDSIETIDLLKDQKRTNKWTDYLKGIIVEMQLLNKNISKGFDAVVYGDLPNGAGLSSSASIEMAFVLTLLGINGYEIPDNGSKEMVEYSLLAQRCENNFVGVNCGIMDQFISANAKKIKAVLLDCYDLNYKYSNIDLKNNVLLVANTMKRRRLEESKYNERRKECETGFEMIKKYVINKKVLGRIDVDEWNKIKDKIDNNMIKKRLEHVISENDRVKKAYESMNSNNIEIFTELLNLSGDSLKNNYEVTGKYLDALVNSARTTEGVLASRMTGAGFGGCTINIVNKRMIEKTKKEISKKYYKKTKIFPEFYEFEISDGAKQIFC